MSRFSHDITICNVNGENTTNLYVCSMYTTLGLTRPLPSASCNVCLQINDLHHADMCVTQLSYILNDMLAI